MAERARQLLAVLPLLLTGSACLPLEDLQSYSSALGSPGGSSGALPAFDVAGGGSATSAAGSAGADGEQIAGPLPLVPGSVGADAGGAGGTNDGTGAAPFFADSGVAGVAPCDLAFEFTSEDGSSCYRLSGDVAIWSDARAACLGWGGDLVSIETMTEDLFLEARAEGAVLWIGANDLDAEGAMVWPSGAPFLYTNWAPTQPDDFMGQEDCVEKRAAGGWNDRLCGGNPLRYVCER